MTPEISVDNISFLLSMQVDCNQGVVSDSFNVFLSLVAKIRVIFSLNNQCSKLDICLYIHRLILTLLPYKGVVIDGKIDTSPKFKTSCKYIISSVASKNQNGRQRSDCFFTTNSFRFLHLLRHTIYRNPCSLYLIALSYHLIMAAC